jgi:SAM-dependent methyltransferase
MSEFRDNLEGRFPNWKKLYEELPVETMPWYSESLDFDLEREIKERGLNAGRFLDLGTGPGTQAAELAKRGFTVTGTDLSPAAIEGAKRRVKSVELVQDDILASKLKEPFAYVFDRGCFHVLPPESRSKYVETVHRLLEPRGLLFLKCFSVEEPDQGTGPHRFDEAMLREVFSAEFDFLSVKQSYFEGTRDPKPRALFSVLRARN